MIIIVINNNLFLFWRKLTRKLNMIKCALRDGGKSEVRTEKWKKMREY